MKACISCLAATALICTSQIAMAEITVTDIEGRRVTLEALPERVALGFYYEDYLAVAGEGATDKLVSLSRGPWANWRPKQWQTYTSHFPTLANLPDFGSTDDGTFSAETLIASRPDVVILASWQFDALGNSLDQIESAGIRVIALDYNAQTLERHIESTRVLGDILGQPERAENLVSLYKNKTQDTLSRVQLAGSTDKKIYVELAQKGPDEIGNSYGRGMWAGVIQMLGGQNIAEGQIGNWGPLSAEYIISQQPDIVLLAGSEWSNQPQSVQMGFGATNEMAQERLSAYAQRAGWDSFPAVQNNDIYGIYHGGNRTLSDFVYVRAIAKALYPQAFTDVDPAQELQDYYTEWLPIAADGLFVTRLK